MTGANALSTGAGIGTARQAAADVVTRSRSSFTLAMRMMPKPRRRAMFAVYAFARAVDDIADGTDETEEKRRQLNEWRAEIEHIYKGTPETPLGHALQEAARAFDLPKAEFLLLIDGMDMDCGEPICAPPLGELLTYTRRVAGTIGLLSMPIFGAPRTAAAERFALALADALQLTNILRDVREDAEIGRLYLPADFLDAEGIATRDPAEAAADPRTARVCARLGTIARASFDTAKTEAGNLKRGHIRPALMMMGVYESYLNRLEQAGWPVLEPLPRSGHWAKLAQSMRYAFRPPGIK